MVAALLHDIGLVKGDKIDHAIESSKIFMKSSRNQVALLGRCRGAADVEPCDATELSPNLT